MLLPYHVVLPNGHETILLLTKKHQERDFPDAVLVDEDSPAQDEKLKTTRRTRKTTS